jgi:hypothetical protein
MDQQFHASTLDHERLRVIVIKPDRNCFQKMRLPRVGDTDFPGRWS